VTTQLSESAARTSEREVAEASQTVS